MNELTYNNIASKYYQEQNNGPDRSRSYKI